NSSSNGGGIVSEGGGIGVRSMLVVNNSTIVGNSASGEGGGIRNDFSSQGVGAMTLTNCTITGNSAGQPGTRSISGGGISNNGSADDSPANIGGCIIARNTGVRGTDVVGNFISLGYNLVGDTGGSNGFNQPTDQTGLDPGLELDGSNQPLLKDNGG